MLIRHIDSALDEAFKKVTLCGYGTNFTLLMEKKVSNSNEDDDYKVEQYSIHMRPDQPCQGGEMRKYKSTHGNKCTKPESERPSDLYHPFPSGKPVAVGVKFEYGPYDRKYKPIFDLLFSTDSPYRRGVGTSELLYDFENEGVIQGVIIQDTQKIDPTVMVNLLQFINSMGTSGLDRVLEMVEYGATIAEGLAFVQLGSSAINETCSATYDYYFATRFSPRRFIDGDPKDLSGGTYYDGFDYDRIHVQDLFEADDVDSAMIWQRETQPYQKSDGMWGETTWNASFYDVIFPKMLELFREKLDLERRKMTLERAA